MEIGNQESKKGYKRWFDLMEKDFRATMQHKFAATCQKMELSPFKYFQ
jgi:hypothetical protein